MCLEQHSLALLWGARATWVLLICVQQKVCDTYVIAVRIPNNPPMPIHALFKRTFDQEANKLNSSQQTTKRRQSRVTPFEYWIGWLISHYNATENIWDFTCWSRSNRNAMRMVLQTGQECYQFIASWGKLLWWEIAVNHSFPVFQIGTSCFVACCCQYKRHYLHLNDENWTIFLQKLFGIKQQEAKEQGCTIFTTNSPKLVAF